MRQLPSRFRRLDDALADLPVEEPMLLSELDGFLTGVLVSPEPILSGEWMQSVWGSDESGVPPFDDPIDVRWFADAVTARQNEVARDLKRGKLQPIFDIDGRSHEVLWELWLEGFAEAMALRPESWAALEGDADRELADALARLSLLIAVARNDSSLDSAEINAIHEEAPAAIVEAVLRLYVARQRNAVGPAPAAPGKIGRNEPCRCGSGKKSKRCCGGDPATSALDDERRQLGPDVTETRRMSTASAL